jgi:hypothetical protein
MAPADPDEPAETATVPRFIPVAREPEAPQPAPVLAQEARVPGATLTGGPAGWYPPRRAPRHAVGTLARVAAVMTAQTDPQALAHVREFSGHAVPACRPVLPVVPVPVAEPEPRHAAPAGTWLRDYLVTAFDDASLAVWRRLTENDTCPACHASPVGYCQGCASQTEQSARYEALCKLHEAAPDDNAVVDVLFAEGWR